MAETISSANAAASTLFLGHNGEWWDFWLIISVIAAALVATAIGVTTAGSIISHKRETAAAEQVLDRYKMETGKQIAEANAAGDAAKAEAAKARLALERYKGPRNIPTDKFAAIEAEVSKFPGTPYDLSLPSRLEPGSFLVNQLIGTLRKGKWELRSHKGDNILIEPLDPSAAVDSLPLSMLAPGSHFQIPVIWVARNDGVLRGILITYDIKHAHALFDAVFALAGALNGAGILTEAYAADPIQGQAEDVIHIAIGTKP